jgi:carbon-monoxide dehydrogenase small subunit
MRFTLNGKRRDVAAPPLRRLLDVLREDCGLLDGQPVASCLVPCAQAQGTRVTTIEGLGGDHPLQRCFVEQGGAQCGICTPGMIMAAMVLPPGAGLPEIREALAGNLCRCTGYTAIYRSVAAALRPTSQSARKPRPKAKPARKPKTRAKSK